MSMFVVPRDRPHSRPEFRPHIGEREGNNTSGRVGENLTVSVNVSLLVHGTAPELLGLGLGLEWRHELSQNRETQVIPLPAFYWVRVRVEDISAKTRASSVNPLNNSCYLVASFVGLGLELGLELGLGFGLRVRVRVRAKA